MQLPCSHESHCRASFLPQLLFAHLRLAFVPRGFFVPSLTSDGTTLFASIPEGQTYLDVGVFAYLISVVFLTDENQAFAKYSDTVAFVVDLSYERNITSLKLLSRNNSVRHCLVLSFVLEAEKTVRRHWEKHTHTHYQHQHTQETEQQTHTKKPSVQYPLPPQPHSHCPWCLVHCWCLLSFSSSLGASTRFFCRLALALDHQCLPRYTKL